MAAPTSTSQEILHSPTIPVVEEPPPSYAQSDIISHGYKMISQVLMEPMQEYYCEADINDQFFLRFQIFPFAAGAQRLAFHGSIYERVAKGNPSFCAYAVAKFEMASTYLMESTEEVRTKVCADEAEKTVKKHNVVREFVTQWKALGINKDVYVLSTEKMTITKGCSLLDIRQQDSPMLYYLFKMLGLDTVLYPGAVGSVEDQLSGKFVKFLNNDGRANDEVSANFPGAFAHWTWVQSGGRLMISDIQGIRTADGYTLTDPCVHSLGDAHGFGRSDLGFEGVEEFFGKHKCNDLCRDLKLGEHGMDLDLGHNIRTRIRISKGKGRTIDQIFKGSSTNGVDGSKMSETQDKSDSKYSQGVNIVKAKKSEEKMKIRKRAVSEGSKVVENEEKKSSGKRRNSFWPRERVANINDENKEKRGKNRKGEKGWKWTDLLILRKRR